MKVTQRNLLKEVRDTITFATVFTLTVTGPATLIAGVILLTVRRSEMLSSIVFVGILAAAILGMFWWPRRRLAPFRGSKSPCMSSSHTSGCTPNCCHREEPSSSSNTSASSGADANRWPSMLGSSSSAGKPAQPASSVKARCRVKSPAWLSGCRFCSAFFIGSSRIEAKPGFRLRLP